VVVRYFTRVTTKLKVNAFAARPGATSCPITTREEAASILRVAVIREQLVG
jgi:hypothetical protein